MIEVKKYRNELKEDWNSFLNESKNGTFMFQREFIEYHKKKFVDYSLMLYKNDKLIGLLPANIDGKILNSHGGLTYGGLIVEKNIKLNEYLKIFKSMLSFLDKNGISELNYKSIPIFYLNAVDLGRDLVIEEILRSSPVEI